MKRHMYFTIRQRVIKIHNIQNHQKSSTDAMHCVSNEFYF